MSKKLEINKGDRYGRLTIVKEVEPLMYKHHKRRRFECSCDCGNTHTVLMYLLKSNQTVSCGCKKIEVLNERSHKHGHAQRNKKHLLYQTWCGMIARCGRPTHSAYKYYGGRGIKVCDRWRNSFQSFIDDMGSRPEGYSLDRIDPNGNYEPNNCRWADKITQRHNQTRMKK